MHNNTALGASLYVPASHKDLAAIANGDLLAHLRSVIFCTEDSVSERELDGALSNLAQALRRMRAGLPTLRFVRVRNSEVMEQVLAMPGVERLAGFVVPKATCQNMERCLRLVRDTGLQLMPTLETVEVFDEAEMKLLRQRLEAPGVRNRIIALRIGGNDLLALLGLRRPRHCTIYQTPLGAVISRLVTTFRPHGFALTSPVFEHLDLPHLLEQEVREDLNHGLVGKTAIHPSQVEQIERHYRVGQREIDMARRIVLQDAPSVFQMHGSMCELATHRGWAHGVLQQGEIFGVSSGALRDGGAVPPDGQDLRGGSPQQLN